jgi:hypothetical protein
LDLKTVVVQLKLERKRIDRAIEMLNGSRGGPREISPEGRAAMRKAQRRRWAKYYAKRKR